VAMIGYDCNLEFLITASEIPPLDEQIAWAMLSRPIFRHACKREGINLSLMIRICGVKRSEFEAMKRENDRQKWCGCQKRKEVEAVHSKREKVQQSSTWAGILESAAKEEGRQREVR